MLYCTTQPITGYSMLHETKLFRVGIGTLADKQPSMFSLLSIMSPLFYQWEAGSPVPEDKRCAALDAEFDSIYTRTLSSSVGGLSLVNWLSMFDSPVSFYMSFGQYPMSGLPLLEHYDVDQIRLIMRGRCYSWLKAHPHESAQTLLTVFTKEDEREVKEAAYGAYYRP